MADGVPDEIRALVTRADDLMKAATNRPDPAVGRDAAREALHGAVALVEGLPAGDERDALVVLVGRRLDDLGVATRADELSAAAGDGPRSVALPQPGPATLDAPVRRPSDQREAPGQRLVAGLPVLHVGRAPQDRSRASFRLRITGLVTGRRRTLGWDALTALPHRTITTDIHCVTGWSRLGATWTGVRVADLIDHLGVEPLATHALVYGANAYSANLDLATLRRDDTLLAWAFDGEPLTPEHGAPLRLVCPSRYFWKSTKWVDTIQLLDRDVPGYWEARGYHNVADPHLEQRYG